MSPHRGRSRRFPSPASAGLRCRLGCEARTRSDIWPKDRRRQVSGVVGGSLGKGTKAQLTYLFSRRGPGSLPSSPMRLTGRMSVNTSGLLVLVFPASSSLVGGSTMPMMRETPTARSELLGPLHRHRKKPKRRLAISVACSLSRIRLFPDGVVPSAVISTSWLQLLLPRMVQVFRDLVDHGVWAY